MKHNNNLSASSSKKCKCGRYITLGEEKAGIGLFNYVCPNCQHYENNIRYRKWKKQNS